MHVIWWPRCSQHWGKSKILIPTPFRAFYNPGKWHKKIGLKMAIFGPSWRAMGQLVWWRGLRVLTIDGGMRDSDKWSKMPQYRAIRWLQRSKYPSFLALFGGSASEMGSWLLPHAPTPYLVEMALGGWDSVRALSWAHNAKYLRSQRPKGAELLKFSSCDIRFPRYLWIEG